MRKLTVINNQFENTTEHFINFDTNKFRAAFEDFWALKTNH